VILGFPSVTHVLNGAKIRCFIFDEFRTPYLINQICSMPALSERVATFGFTYVEGETVKTSTRDCLILMASSSLSFLFQLLRQFKWAVLTL